MGERNHIEIAASFQLGGILDLHKTGLNDRVETAANISESGNSLLQAREMLEYCHRDYVLSKRLEDFVLVPVVILPSDLPNRNGVAFPYETLTAWCRDAGAPAYKTWTGQPTYYEHANSDPRAAKGVIFDTAMRPLKNVVGNFWKVVALCGFDRTKDPRLVNDILTGKINSYSMGAKVGEYTCSITGHNFTETETGSEWLDHPRARVNKLPFTRTPTGELAYYKVHDVCGFETSAVHDPAYVSAQTDEFMVMFRD